MRAVQQQRFGGPEVLELVDLPDPTPTPDQVRVAVEAAGVHLLDTSIRSGASGVPGPPVSFPMVPGREVAGTIDAVGADVDPSWIGRRVVAHLGFASGGYASAAVVAADAAIPLGDGVDASEAVAMVGTGRTSLAVADVAAFTADDVVLVTSAAGGMGTLLLQLARASGGYVIGAAGGQDKVGSLVDRADLAVDYDRPDWGDRVRADLGDRAVTVVLDAIGGTRGRTAFDLLAPGGRIVLYGYSSGTVTPITTDDLFARGVTATAAIGPRLLSRPDAIRAYATSAMGALADGRLAPRVHSFPLEQAAAAHAALEARETTGKVVLVP